MKKIVAVFLAFMILALFAACGDKDSDQPSMLLTDIPTLASTPSQPNVNVNVSATPSQSSGGNSSPTMILTTQRGQVMPTVVTTDFVADPAVAQQNNSTAPNFDLTIPSSMTTPVVYTSNTPTTKPVTTQSTTQSTSSTEPEEEEEPTEKQQPVPKAISEESVGMLSNRQYEITFSSDGWGGGVKTKSSKIAVVDSNGTTRVVNARVAGKDADGNYRILIDTSDLDEGDIRFTLPSQFVESKDGLTYSSEYSASANISWD